MDSGLGVDHLTVTSVSCSFVFLFFPFSLVIKMCLLFDFSCIALKYVSLLASLVPEFDFWCFLRSRCSTEMRCPDNTGRDSWDWVGEPTWERA